MRVLFWFRKDLRPDDNTGLAEAARDSRGNVVPFYASKPEILSRPTGPSPVLSCPLGTRLACAQSTRALCRATPLLA